jgi:hypothetical protein
VLLTFTDVSVQWGETRAVLSQPKDGIVTSTTSSTSPTSSTSTAASAGAASERYVAPDFFTHRIFNPMVAFCTRRGVSLWGSRVLQVPGRTSGVVRSTPVNVLAVGNERYLVAPRGAAQWVRNVRSAGWCDLRVGRRVEHVEVEEMADVDKPEILRAYLRRWAWEVGKFFDGVGPDASDEELLAVADGYPVFRLRPAG